MKTCSVDGCEKGGRMKRGWCSTHYQRWQRHGDPHAGIEKFQSPEESFAARVAWDGEHLLWIGSDDGGLGYGRIRVDGRMVGAHRYSYEREHGQIPEGMWVDHKCWTPACVLPDHLRLATPQQNRQYLSGALPGRTLPRGVFRVRERYQAIVGHGGVNHYLGTFDTVAEASAAATNKRKILFGEYAGRA